MSKVEYPGVRDLFGTGPSYWLVGEVSELPPVESLVATRQRMAALGLIVSERMSGTRIVDPARGPRYRTTTWRAALRDLRLGDYVYDGGNDLIAGFQFEYRLLVCRVPAEYPDAPRVVWELAPQLHCLWNPDEFYVVFNVRYHEPYVFQHRDLISAPWASRGLYGYSWIVGARDGVQSDLALGLLEVAAHSDTIQAVRTDAGVLARMGEHPSVADPETRHTWATLLRPWLKRSNSPTTPPPLITGANKTAPWVIWHEPVS